MICGKCAEFADIESRIIRHDTTAVPRLGHAECNTTGCTCQHRAGPAIPEHERAELHSQTHQTREAQPA